MNLVLHHPWPALNAFLNGISALFLALGFRFIRRGAIAPHRACMLSAFSASVVFLVSYLAYHAQVGHVRYPGSGLDRTIYLGILLTHTVLAFVIVPMILRTLYLAVKQRFAEHRRLARWTLPIWFYVSVTGVVIFVMLYGKLES
jgi:putative membrane protein